MPAPTSTERLIGDIAAAHLDRMGAEVFSPIGGTPALVVDLAQGRADEHARLAARVQAVLIGVDRTGATPPIDPDAFDVLITSKPHAPAPWISVTPNRLDEHVASLCAEIRNRPIAAATLCKVLRIGQTLDWSAALAMESMAYSMLLGGAEFRAWRASQPDRPRPDPAGSRVIYDREGDQVVLTLANPATRNATDATMRDALWEALLAVLEDPSEPDLLLLGAGDCFCVGGHLGEFGRADDLALAHVVRTLRSPATLLHQLGERATVLLHGACIGAGVEIAAAAAVRLAKPGAFFQLPEVSMGLIPGAGGTVTLARAIGRHRTAYMALSGRRIRLDLACEWGLVEPADGS